MIVSTEIFLLCSLIIAKSVDSFNVHSGATISSLYKSQTTHLNCQYVYHQIGSTELKMSDTEIDVEFEDDDEAEVGTMRVSEIKSELTLRGVNFSDCFDKESLAVKLRDARASGKADPTIIDQFNKQNSDFDKSKMEIDDDILEQATGGDGTLPGGMPPDMLQNLMSNPELMTLMQNPKMQDVMKLMMTDGSEALEKKMREDKEIREIVTKLNSVMGNLM